MQRTTDSAVIYSAHLKGVSSTDIVVVAMLFVSEYSSIEFL